MKAISLLKKLKDTQRLSNIGYKISQQLDEEIAQVASLAKMENKNTRNINKRVKGQIRNSRKANKQIEKQVDEMYENLKDDLTNLRLGKQLDNIDSVQRRRLAELDKIIVEKKINEDSVEAMNELLSYYDLTIPEYEVFKKEIIARENNKKQEDNEEKNLKKREKKMLKKFDALFKKLKF